MILMYTRLLNALADNNRANVVRIVIDLLNHYGHTITEVRASSSMTRFQLYLDMADDIIGNQDIDLGLFGATHEVQDIRLVVVNKTDYQFSTPTKDYVFRRPMFDPESPYPPSTGMAVEVALAIFSVLFDHPPPHYSITTSTNPNTTLTYQVIQP